MKRKTYKTDGREWSLEELARCSPELTRQAEETIKRAAEIRQRQADEQVMRAVYGDSARPFAADPPWDAQAFRYADGRDPRVRDHWRGTSTQVEVITDPNDRRGLDAKRARVPA